MMIIYILILFSVALTAMLLYKDILAPPVIYCFPWILCIAGLLVSEFSYSSYSPVFIYIIIGTILFQIGYVVTLTSARLRNRYKSGEFVLTANYGVLIMFIIMEILIIINLYYILYEYIINNFYRNIYTSMMLGLITESLVIPGYLNYARNIISVATICIILMFFYIHEDERRRYKPYMVIQIVLVILNLCTVMTRNGLLFVMLPILICIIILTNIKNRLTIKYLISFFIFFMIIFAVFAVNKFYFQFEGSPFMSVLTDNITVYLSGSIVALERYLSCTSEYLYGANTFRFFIAVFNKITGLGTVPQLVQDSVYISNSMSTNVYTFYYYYARDFGIWYALIIQFCVGLLHGFSYRAMLSKKPYNVFIFSILVYPLVMQFFQDQYLSLLSVWIQYFVIGMIFLKTKLFFSYPMNVARKGEQKI